MSRNTLIDPSIVKMAPNDHRSTTTCQQVGASWSVVKSKRRNRHSDKFAQSRRGSCDSGFSASSDDSSEISSSSNYEDSLLDNTCKVLNSKTNDIPCKVLLAAANSDWERLDAVILAALAHDECPEVFTEAEKYSSEDRMFPRSVERFAHPSGDLHTSMRAIHHRLDHERNVSHPVPLTDWCCDKHFNPEAIQYVLTYIEEFRHLWDHEENDKCRQENNRNQRRYDPILDTLSNSLHTGLCIYRGHPDLGYMSLYTGDVVNICPASTLHLLTKMPRFVVKASIRHTQGALKEVPCFNLIPVGEDQARFLALEDLPQVPIDSVHTVSLVEEAHTQKQGIRPTEVFCQKWSPVESKNNSSDETLQAKASRISINAPVLLDQQESMNTNQICLYASKEYHKSLSTFVHDEMHKIQRELNNQRGQVPFPRPESQFRLVIGPGFTCERLLFPYEECDQQSVATVRALDNIPMTPCELFHFNTYIHISVLMPNLSHLHATDDTIKFDQNFTCKSIIKKLFTLLNKDRWEIQDIIETEDGCTELDVVCSDHVTATRALLILRDSPIPVQVLNEHAAKQSMKSFELTVNKKLMQVLGEELIRKVERFAHSRKNKAEYKICPSNLDGTLIQMMFDTVCGKSRVQEELTTLLNPLPSDKLSRKSTYFLKTKEGSFVIRKISEETNSHLYWHIQSQHVLIFGQKAAKKLASEKLSTYLEHCLLDFANGHFVLPKKFAFNISWLSLGKLQVDDSNELPDDFYVTFKQHHINLDKLFNEAQEVRVDTYHKEIWVEAFYNAPTFDQHRETFANLAKTWLSQGYDIHARKVCVVNDKEHEAIGNIVTTGDTGDETEAEEEFTCVVCYSSPQTAYIVESCGHTYCTECFGTQIVNTVKGETCLLSCVDCGEPFSLADLANAVVDLRLTPLKKLLKSAVRQLLRKDPQTYRECRTPNCDGISRLDKPTGVMKCGVCSHRLCGLCFELVHKGMTCEEYKASVLSIERWMNEQKNRKTCTFCRMGIEKLGGCNNVHCVYCKKSLCWVCLEYFDHSQDCYNHMDKTGHWN